MTNPNYTEILVSAHLAAYEATKDMKENPHAFDCGFAWVNIDGTHPLARFCRTERKDKLDLQAIHGLRPTQFFGDKGYPRGWQWWCPGNKSAQSIHIHRAGAAAFAKVLGEHNIVATVSSRLD